MVEKKRYYKRRGNKLNATPFDIIYKIVKPFHLEKLQSY